MTLIGRASGQDRLVAVKPRLQGVAERMRCSVPVSAAHPCLQGVAERMESSVLDWNIKSGTLSREIGVPTGTAHSADPLRTNRPMLIML